MRTRFTGYMTWLSATILMVGLALAGAIAAIDPYGERAGGRWHSLAANPLSAAKFLDRLEEGPAVLVFGTSRSRFIGAAVTGEPTLNLHALYGDPRAVLGFLRRLDPRQVGNVRRVVYLLDGHTFDGDANYDPADYTSPVARALYRLAHARTYLRNAVDKAVGNLGGSLSYWIEESGETHDASEPRYDGRLRVIEDHRRASPEAVATLAEVDAFARAHGIAIDYVMPAFPVGFLPSVDLAGLEQMLRAFVAVLPGGVHDLSWTPGISDRAELFYDFSHLNVAGTKAAFPGGRPLGEPVTAATIEDHLAALKRAVAGLPAAPRM